MDLENTDEIPVGDINLRSFQGRVTVLRRTQVLPTTILLAHAYRVDPGLSGPVPNISHGLSYLILSKLGAPGWLTRLIFCFRLRS